MRVTLKQNRNLTRILDSQGRVIGEIRRIQDRDYSYESRLALAPYRNGRCKSIAEGLAQLGYKVVKPRPKRNRELSR